MGPSGSPLILDVYPILYTDGSAATHTAVDLHDVRLCSRCGEDCSALYPEGVSVGPLFHAVPCTMCDWDTGLEYSDAEAYSHGYGEQLDLLSK